MMSSSGQCSRSVWWLGTVRPVATTNGFRLPPRGRSDYRPGAMTPARHPSHVLAVLVSLALAPACGGGASETKEDPKTAKATKADAKKDAKSDAKKDAKAEAKTAEPPKAPPTDEEAKAFVAEVDKE